MEHLRKYKHLCVFLIVLLTPVSSTDTEGNITFYNKDLANGKISSELAAIGGLQGIAKNIIQPSLNGFVSPNSQGKTQPVPIATDQTGNVYPVQNLSAAGGTIPLDGGFTQWTLWSRCPVSCGRTALRSRERYCTNPAPINGGRNCDGPRFQLKLCKMKECGQDGYTPWGSWSKCSNQCGKGYKHRSRHCINPNPINGVPSCKGRRKEVSKCIGKVCTDQNSIVDIDPKTVCGYDPCAVAKCISMPYATCVSDFKCKPVFFDSEERRVEGCKGTDLYLTINPSTVCRFDPCKYTTCMTATPAKCLVNTKCHPVFLDAFGKTMKCKGVFKVPARYICGHNPCSSAMCKAEPSARCLVDHQCKPIFVNAAKNVYKQCSERGQIIRGPKHDDDDDDNDDDDPLRQLMKGKQKKHKPINEETNDEVNQFNPENQDTPDSQGNPPNDDVMEDTMGEKKSKVHIPARFIGKR
ncbi:Mucin-like protein [Exaiptasia diaphana]|nr:Mucin-like protein [Exaiptasia diaphana]